MSLFTNFQDLAKSVKLALDRKADKSEIPVIPELATVATSGSYNDLSDKPTIPTAGTIASGSTGYATGGDVYTAIGNIPQIPVGTNTGDILVWNGHDWVTKPKWHLYYQPCEYVESSYTGASGPYIDTGFSPTNKTSIEAEVAFTDNSATSGQYMGMRYWPSSSDTRALFFGLRYTGGTRYLALFTMYPEATPAQIPFDTDFHSYTINPSSQKIDSYSFSLDYSTMPTSPQNMNITLFSNNARYNNDPPENIRAKSKIKSFKIKEDGVLVRDFVPCYNIYTDEIGMFDTVSNQFYTNAGTGTFLKGADV